MNSGELIIDNAFFLISHPVISNISFIHSLVSSCFSISSTFFLLCNLIIAVSICVSLFLCRCLQLSINSSKKLGVNNFFQDSLSAAISKKFDSQCIVNLFINSSVTFTQRLRRSFNIFILFSLSFSVYVLIFIISPGQLGIDHRQSR